MKFLRNTRRSKRPKGPALEERSKPLLPAVESAFDRVESHRVFITNLSEDELSKHCQTLNSAADVQRALRLRGLGDQNLPWYMFVLLKRGPKLNLNTLYREIAKSEQDGYFVWRDQLRYAKGIFKAVAEQSGCEQGVSLQKQYARGALFIHPDKLLEKGYHKALLLPVHLVCRPRSATAQGSGKTSIE